MKAHQERVVHEKHELEERLGKLEKFLTTDVCLDLPFAERVLLVQQAKIMKDYSNVLQQRIALFSKE